jgi:hypothetical protein
MIPSTNKAWGLLKESEGEENHRLLAETQMDLPGWNPDGLIERLSSPRAALTAKKATYAGGTI